MSSPRRKAFMYKRTDLPSRIELVVNDVKVPCKPVLDGLTLLEFAGATASADSDGDDPAAQAAAAIAVLDFLKTSVLDWKLFSDTIRAEDSGVGAEELAEMAGWLVEQYVERPTK